MSNTGPSHKSHVFSKRNSARKTTVYKYTVFSSWATSWGAEIVYRTGHCYRYRTRCIPTPASTTLLSVVCVSTVLNGRDTAHGHARGTAKGAHTQRQRHSCVSDGANMKKRHPPMSMSLSDTETESPTSLQSVSVRFVERAVLIMWALCRCGVNSAPRRRVDEVGALPHWLGAVKHVAS